MIDGKTARPAWGWGLATVHESGQVLDTYFPRPALGRADDSEPPPELAAEAGADDLRAVRTDVRRVEVDLNVPPSGGSDAYLRLHLLSHRLVAPRSINLDGIFSQLANVVWTSYGPCAVDGTGSVRGPDDVGQLREDAVEVDASGGDQPVAQQVQPKVCVRTAGRRNVQIDLDSPHIGPNGAEVISSGFRGQLGWRRAALCSAEGRPGEVRVEHLTRLVDRCQAPSPSWPCGRAVDHAGKPRRSRARCESTEAERILRCWSDVPAAGPARRPFGHEGHGYGGTARGVP